MADCDVQSGCQKRCEVELRSINAASERAIAVRRRHMHNKRDEVDFKCRSFIRAIPNRNMLEKARKPVLE